LSDTDEPRNHEIKLLMPPTVVLDVGGMPTSDVIETFELRDESLPMSMQFLDFQRVLDEHGWNVRLRRKGGTHEGELTFKRRFRVEGDSVDAAWQSAREQRIVGADHFRKQLEWNLDRRTLSFSREQQFESPADSELDLPDLRRSVAIVLDELPGRLRELDLAGESVEHRLKHDACLYGPVTGVRWFGTWNKHDLWIERWDIPKSKVGPVRVVEASLVKGDYFDALEIQRTLADFLDVRGWLHNQSELKTKLILDGFAQSGVAASVSGEGVAQAKGGSSR